MGHDGCRVGERGLRATGSMSSPSILLSSGNQADEVEGPAVQLPPTLPALLQGASAVGIATCYNGERRCYKELAALLP